MPPPPHSTSQQSRDLFDDQEAGPADRQIRANAVDQVIDGFTKAALESDHPIPLSHRPRALLLQIQNRACPAKPRLCQIIHLFCDHYISGGGLTVDDGGGLLVVFFRLKILIPRYFHTHARHLNCASVRWTTESADMI